VRSRAKFEFAPARASVEWDFAVAGGLIILDGIRVVMTYLRMVGWLKAEYEGARSVALALVVVITKESVCLFATANTFDLVPVCSDAIDEPMQHSHDNTACSNWDFVGTVVLIVLPVLLDHGDDPLPLYRTKRPFLGRKQLRDF